VKEAITAAPAVARRTRRRARHIRAGNVVAYVLMVLLLALVLAPLYWLVISSAKPAAEVIRQPPTFFPAAWSGQHFSDLFAASDYPIYLRNSVEVAIGTVVLTLVLAAPAAYAVYRIPFRGRGLVLRGFLLAYAFPSIVLLVPLYRMMSAVHLINTLASLVIVNVTFTAPFSVWMLQAFFRTVPVELEEAAAIDGAGWASILIRVLLPLIAPGLITIAIFAFISSWTEFTFASALILDDARKTLPVGLAQIIGQYQIDWGLLAAGAVVAVAPVLIFFGLIGRRFVAGLTAGAIK
jgi:multiple sugar transport system permease protein